MLAAASAAAASAAAASAAFPKDPKDGRPIFPKMHGPFAAKDVKFG